MMRAAVIAERGLPPVLQDFPEPQAREGATLIKVDTAGLGGWDVLGAYRLGVQFPCVIRGEGVGHAPDGRRELVPAPVGGAPVPPRGQGPSASATLQRARARAATPRAKALLKS